jgi:hypothetical protein
MVMSIRSGGICRDYIGTYHYSDAIFFLILNSYPYFEKAVTNTIRARFVAEESWSGFCFVRTQFDRVLED